MGLRVIPSVVFVRGVEPEGQATEARRHCRGQSTQLPSRVSDVIRAGILVCLPVTFELEDGCSIANSYTEHQIILETICIHGRGVVNRGPATVAILP